MRVAVLIPHYADPKARFMASLCDLLTESPKAKLVYRDKPDAIELRCFLRAGSNIAENRTRLLLDAIDWRATYALWCDTDMVFPADALLRLLSHDKPVVAANYARRASRTAPATLKRRADGDLDFVRTTEAKAKAGDLEQVEAPGLGLCLMSLRILDRLQAHALSQGRPHYWPLFLSQPIDEAGRVFEGEDNFFFRQLAAAGVSVFVDHALSVRVGHLHETELGIVEASAFDGDFTSYVNRG